MSFLSLKYMDYLRSMLVIFLLSPKALIKAYSCGDNLVFVGKRNLPRRLLKRHHHGILDSALCSHTAGLKYLCSATKIDQPWLTKFVQLSETSACGNVLDYEILFDKLQFSGLPIHFGSNLLKFF